jgi:tetratricopeptide (TPR) repeat protein
MSDRDLPREIKALDEEIRSGRARLARPILVEWLKTDAHRLLNRPARVEAGSLCRRLGLFSWSVRLLNPWVRPKARAQATLALPEEIAEYAASLSFLGADREALTLLREVDMNKTPQALLFAAFAHFSRWEYQQAIPYLEKYVRHPSLTDYARTIGQVNLAATLIFCERWEEVRALLDLLIENTRSKNYSLLLGTSLMISAQHWIGVEDFERAGKDLAQASALSESIDGMDLLLIEKWRAILKLAGNKMTKSGPGGHEEMCAIASLKNIQAKAMELREWETVRDCDFHLARYTRDLKLGRHLYFGTPFDAYQARLIDKMAMKKPDPSERFEWQIGSRGNVFLIDAVSGESSARNTSLKFGQVPQRLFALLVSDYYRPHRIATLHADLFPDRHYHPLHSPVVLRQVILRLRKWLSENKIPLQIEENQSTYRLKAIRRCEIRVPPLDTGTSSTEDPLRKKKAFTWINALSDELSNPGYITRSRAAGCWNVSERTAFNRLQELVAENLLVREGQGHATRYLNK